MRLLDLSRLLPGPYCSRILCALGFEVIKIEPPGGSDWLRFAPPLHPDSGQGRLFHYLHQGKKSLTLNLKSPEGKELFLRLVETADVLLESFRPGVMERLGLGYEALNEQNPKLIYCSLSGYGTSGTYAGRAGHDLNYLGLAGFLLASGKANLPPKPPPAPVADISGSLWAAIGILYALLERQISNRGQKVESSLFGAAISLLPVALYQDAGQQNEVPVAHNLGGGLVCYNLYETSDRKYMSLAALEPQFWAAFCSAIERPDLLDAQFAPAKPGESAFESIREIFKQRSQKEWQKIFQKLDACCEPVFDLEEALNHNPLKELGMLKEGELLPALKLTESRVLSSLPPPVLGEHNLECYTSLGYTETEIDALKERGII